MTSEAIEKMARELCPGCRDSLPREGAWHHFADGSNMERCYYDKILAALQTVASRVLEEAAQIPDESAIKLLGGKERVNQVDTHVAYVLKNVAEAIRSLSGVAQEEKA